MKEARERLLGYRRLSAWKVKRSEIRKSAEEIIELGKSKRIHRSAVPVSMRRSVQVHFEERMYLLSRLLDGKANFCLKKKGGGSLRRKQNQDESLESPLHNLQNSDGSRSKVYQRRRENEKVQDLIRRPVRHGLNEPHGKDRRVYRGIPHGENVCMRLEELRLNSY